MKILPNYQFNRQAGFSLVELMVAVVIGLIGTLVMFQIFAVSEGQKRTTASGGDAQQNGAIGLFTLERELRNSGHGLTELITLGEPIYGYSVPTSTPRPPIVLKPALITPGDGVNGDLGSDLIEINYSNFVGIGTAIDLIEDWDPNSATISVANPAAFREGDVLVVCNRDGPGSPPCIQVQITDPLGASTTLAVKPNDTYVRSGVTRTTEYNPDTGLKTKLRPADIEGRVVPALYKIKDPLTTDATIVYNLGTGITSHVYRVSGGRLMFLEDGAWVEFADGIVSIRAQYGVDINNDGSADIWENPGPVNLAVPAASFTPASGFPATSRTVVAASWSRVVAIRVAIVARSGIKEKTMVEPRTTIPLWTNPVGNPVPGPSYAVPSGDGQYYRYRVFESIVPFRNMVWNP